MLNYLRNKTSYLPDSYDTTACSCFTANISVIFSQTFILFYLFIYLFIW